MLLLMDIRNAELPLNNVIKEEKQLQNLQ